MGWVAMELDGQGATSDAAIRSARLRPRFSQSKSQSQS